MILERWAYDTLAWKSMSEVAQLSESGLNRSGVSSGTTIALNGKPLDARLPLSLLEAVRLIDTPAAELEAEYVEELRSKRFGLSDTVLHQIRRYGDAVRAGNRVGYDEVLLLSRLIGRRPDADIAFREAGRRWARAVVEGVSSFKKSAARGLPSFLARPVALGVLRQLAKRYFGGTLVRQGSTVILRVESPVSADAAPRGVGCGLYEAALREALHLLADSDGTVDHISCRSRGDSCCQWRTDWRRL